MIIKGQYTSAEIFTENIEDAALQWVKAQCDHPAFEGIRIVQMPDVHAGNSCNVGTVYRIGAYLNPDHVGVDIGCTISMHRLSSAVAPEDFALLDHRIREAIPTGMEICGKNSLNEKELFRFLDSQYRKARSSAPDLINEVPSIDASFVSDFCGRIKLQEAIFYKSLGTLGGGNHFIEYGEGEQTHEGWLTIHCGSRNLGVKVANHWHNIAANPKRAQYIGYLWGDALNGYLSDMVIAQAYALYNHHIICDRIFAILKNSARLNARSLYSPRTIIFQYAGNIPCCVKEQLQPQKGSASACLSTCVTALPSVWAKEMQIGTVPLRTEPGAPCRGMPLRKISGWQSLKSP